MEMVMERKSDLIMPTIGYELDREEMSYVDGGSNFLYEVGLGIIDIIGVFSAIGAWLRTAGFWTKIAVTGWEIATKASLAGSWNGAGIVAALGLLVAGVGLIAPCVIIAYAGLSSAIGHFQTAISYL